MDGQKLVMETVHVRVQTVGARPWHSVPSFGFLEDSPVR